MKHYIFNAIYPQADTVGPNKATVSVPVVLRSEKDIDRRDFEGIIEELMEETGSNLFHVIDKLKLRGFERVPCIYAQYKTPEMPSEAILGLVGRNPYQL